MQQQKNGIEALAVIMVRVYCTVTYNLYHNEHCLSAAPWSTYSSLTASADVYIISKFSTDHPISVIKLKLTTVCTQKVKR